MSDSNDALREYRDKRDPAATNEPFSAAAAPSAESVTWVGDFVVHLHAATRRHHDLRLQVGGVLKSFAVPRGPSLDPQDKRLAVQTEDHPYEYLDFEDVIPEGAYGAGPMIVWDLGRVRYLNEPPEVSLPKGKLDFELYGHKLRGRFALVETTGRFDAKGKQRQWLLLKKQDPHCVPDGDAWLAKQEPSVLSGLRVEQLTERAHMEQALLARAEQLGARRAGFDFPNLVPMLCAPAGAGLSAAERVYELKLDGVRILAERTGQRVRLKYRKPGAITPSYPDIERALATCFAREFIVDGEIVAFDERGAPRFSLLAPRIHSRRPLDVRRAVAEVPVVFVVFDLLALGPWDLTSLPLLERKGLLAELFPGKGLVRMLDHLRGAGQRLFELAEQQQLEGVVSKSALGRYEPGVRSTDWVKHKCKREDDFVVVGWIEGKGSRKLGALELGSYQGERVVYRGRVGGGMTDAVMSELLTTMRPRAGEPHLDGVIEAVRPRHWVEPNLVVRVEYLEWTPAGHLRMPIFKGISNGVEARACDVAPPRELDQELALSHDVVGDDEVPLEGQGQRRSSVGNGARPGRVQLSNREKLFWPGEGITKGDLLDYYAAVAHVLLPHLRERPIMLVRYPDGITGKSFYQWNTPAGTPDWVETLQLRDEERDGKQVTTFLVDDVDSLLHVINLGCIPIHVLASRRGTLDHCDFLTIDFDLGEQPFAEAVRLALGLRELLTELGLSGFPKTSGQTGLHVFIPLGPGIPFPIAKVLVELLGRLLQARFVETSTMERRVRERGGRIYIDTGQTGRSRTIVAPYSVRAYPGGRVSTPLRWEEVHLALKPEAFDLFTLPERLATVGDPMAPLLELRPDVPSAVVKLEKWVKG